MVGVLLSCVEILKQDFRLAFEKNLYACTFGGVCKAVILTCCQLTGRLFVRGANN